MISEVGFDEMYGARPLKRAIQDKVEDFISEEVIKGTIKENGMYHISYKDEKVVFVELDETTQEEPKKEKKKKTSQKKPKV
jgi:ATP-dependent Clp protease ATP-binding subunit ClpC